MNRSWDPKTKKPRESSRERVNQKRRTRQAILDGTNRILVRGEKPRLAAVAEESLVSRATVYRYFPSEKALIIEATLDQRVASPAEILANASPDCASERAAKVQEFFYRMAVENEPSFRQFLAAQFEHFPAESESGPENASAVPRRGGRRVESLEQALEPIRGKIDTQTFHRLRSALSVMIGVESLIVLRDVCGLTVDEGYDVMDWAVRQFVKSVAGENA